MTDLGLSIIELKKGGITANELKENDVDAGFTLQELKDVFNEKDDVEKFKEDGISAKELYDAGFTLQFLYSDGRRGYSYNLDDIVKIVKGIHEYEHDQVNTLKEAGYSNDDLTIAGYIFYIDKLGNMVQPSIYIADDNLLSDPTQLQTLLKTSDKKIQFFDNDEEIYYKFYTLLTEYVYKQYGNENNMKDLKKNWKISLYDCNIDPALRHKFSVSQFTQLQHKKPFPKPTGIWGSELYDNEKSRETWIDFVLENKSSSFTGYPKDCSGFLIFRLNDSNKILHVLGSSNFYDTTDFEDASVNFAKYKKINPMFEGTGIATYDWTTFAQDYDAINVQTHIKNWDVRSTVVWKESAVAEYHFLTLRDLPFVKGFVNCEQLFSDANK